MFHDLRLLRTLRKQNSDFETGNVSKIHVTVFKFTENEDFRTSEYDKINMYVRLRSYEGKQLNFLK